MNRAAARLRAFRRPGVAAALAALLAALWLALLPAAAQEAPGDLTTLVADVVRIEGEDVLVAEGNVEVYARGARLRADRLTYDSTKDRLRIEGPIELQDGTGTILLADAADLTPDMTEGILTGARIILNQQLQIAGAEAIRRQDRFTDLKRVVASSCEVCAGSGPPLWEIRASRVIHDEAKHQIYFYNARFRIAGIPVFYAPALRVPDGTEPRVRGFLAPVFYSTNQLGNGLKLPYFIPLGDHADLTLTPFVATDYTRTLEGRYRQAFANGDLTINGAVSRDSILPDQTRGYAIANGTFTLPNNFLLLFTLEGVSDNAYLQDYDYSEQDYLTNAVGVVRTQQNERIEANLIATRSLRADTDTSRAPDLEADAHWDRRRSEGVLGGWLDFGLAGHAHQLNSLDDVDSEGDELGQFRATGGWTRNWTGPVGLRFNATGRINADMLQITDDPDYPEFQTALTPQAAVTLSWPLFKATGNGVRHLIEPVAQLAWTADNTLDAPNVDSTEVALDTGNLLSLNRFPGLNRYEEGARANLALRWTRYDPEAWTYGLTAGQVVHFDATNQFDFSTSLSGRTSNWLGQVDIGFTDKLALRSVVLLDSSLEPTTNETRLAFNAWNVILSSNYIWQRADVTEDPSDDDLSAIGAAASYVLNDTWSANAEVRRDFTAEKTTYREVGLGYQNECVRVDLSVTQKFRATVDEEPITSYQFSVALAGFGSGANAVRRQRCTSGG